MAITITGTNDAAIVSSAIVALDETNAALTASGTLTSTDVDNPNDTFTASSTTGAIGAFSINTAGAWSFTANSAFNSLNVTDNVTETYNVTSVDGTASTVAITITGTNDAAVIAGASSGSVTEDSVITTASGDLLSTDVDNTTDFFQSALGSATYGNYSVTTSGVWTYTLDNTNTTVSALNNGQTLSDSFTVLSADGTSKAVSILINGADEIYNGTIGNDTLSGTAGNDILNGAQGNDTLRGLGGNDQLFGGQGNDILDGGTGNDILTGGTGSDTLIGGIGADRFVFEGSGSANGVDLITDFSISQGDVLDLSAFFGTAGTLIDGNTGVSGTQAFSTSTFGSVLAAGNHFVVVNGNTSGIAPTTAQAAAILNGMKVTNGSSQAILLTDLTDPTHKGYLFFGNEATFDGNSTFQSAELRLVASITFTDPLEQLMVTNLNLM